MAENNRAKCVGTDARKRLVEQDYGWVEEVKMLRQLVADMYHAWMTGKAPPSPPPSCLNSVTTQAPNTITDDPPYSPSQPTYDSFPSHPSSSITRQRYSPPQCYFSPRDSQKHVSLSQYPALQNAYPPSRAYRKPSRSGFRPNKAFKNERLLKKEKAFTSVGGSYASLFQKLKQLGMLKPIHIKVSNPLSEKFDFSRRCAYCSDAPGHDTKKCWKLKKAIQKLIDAGDIVIQNPDATDTSQSPSPMGNEMHMSNMTCFEKEHEKSSEILGGPRVADFLVPSEVALKNEPAKGTQKQFVKNNEMEAGGGPSNIDAEFSG